jgi:nucleoside-diphosphate-sugar epimerase
VTEAFGERAFVVRPRMIVGPEDPIDRYVYWLRRLDETGEVIAPGDPKSPIQVIDVRDLAGWIMSGVEQQLSGVFNATGPARRLSRRDFLERSAAGIGSDAQLVWISDEFLLQHEVGPFEELPYWPLASVAVPTNRDTLGNEAVSPEECRGARRCGKLSSCATHCDGSRPAGRSTAGRWSEEYFF